MIQKAILKKCDLLEESQFAPYSGYTVFIIDNEHMILNDEIYEDIDVEYYSEIFEIIETVY